MEKVEKDNYLLKLKDVFSSILELNLINTIYCQSQIKSERSLIQENSNISSPSLNLIGHKTSPEEFKRPDLLQIFDEISPIKVEKESMIDSGEKNKDDLIDDEQKLNSSKSDENDSSNNKRKSARLIGKKKAKEKLSEEMTRINNFLSTLEKELEKIEDITNISISKKALESGELNKNFYFRSIFYLNTIIQKMKDGKINKYNAEALLDVFPALVDSFDQFELGIEYKCFLFHNITYVLSQEKIYSEKLTKLTNLLLYPDKFKKLNWKEKEKNMIKSIVFSKCSINAYTQLLNKFIPEITSIQVKEKLHDIFNFTLEHKLFLGNLTLNWLGQTTFNNSIVLSESMFNNRIRAFSKLENTTGLFIVVLLHEISHVIVRLFKPELSDVFNNSNEISKNQVIESGYAFEEILFGMLFPKSTDCLRYVAEPENWEKNPEVFKEELNKLKNCSQNEVKLVLSNTARDFICGEAEVEEEEHFTCHL